MKDEITVGQRLKIIRAERGVTIQQLANEAKLSPKTIVAYERDEREPNNAQLKKLSEYFKVPINFILFG